MKKARQYTVTIADESFTVKADSHGNAKYKAIKLYRDLHPKKYSYMRLAIIASVRVAEQLPLGRPRIGETL